MAAPFVDQHAAATFDGDRHVLTLYLNGAQAASTQGIRGALADIDDAYLWLGLAMRKANRNADARKAFTKSLELNPNRLWAKQQLDKTPAN